jgi:enoyl-CoA hydratase
MAFDVSVDKGVAELILNKPPVNAFDSGEWAQLAQLCSSLGRDENVRVVVVAAEGRGFCAGVDIKELAADSSVITRVNRGCYDAFAAIYECSVPVICAVHGFCLGGGIGIAGSSDIVIASDDATFGLPEIDRGALGAATHLMRMFGMPKTRRMLYTGWFPARRCAAPPVSWPRRSRPRAPTRCGSRSSRSTASS